jgi:Predicted AAA-ATPase/PD-(D/E)XK nuclease superfamily
MGLIFPLGTSDFRRIREKNRLYIDKTKTIELMENDVDFITFLRPRRFGKSLLVSTLFYYYDIKSASLFDKLFGDLYIGQHPTEEKNSYYVLRLNFSDLEIQSSSTIQSEFKEMIIERLRNFVIYYATDDMKEKYINDIDENLSLNTLMRRTLLNIAGPTGKVYVLIDEYDHFTNRMIFSNLRGEYKSATHESGYIRQFFTSLKSLTSGPIKRIFITGILPILLNDITSGFNISKSTTIEIFYQGAMGFTEEDVKTLLKIQEIYTDDLYLKIKDLYNGFMFANDPEPTTPKVYNAQMVLSFIDSVSKTGKMPINIINSTFLSDKNKFDFFKSNPKNIEKIRQILESELYASTYNQVLKISEISSTNNLATLLFHFGLLTFHEYTSSTVLYKIPNQAMRELYFEYFKEYLQDNSPGFENVQNIYDITKALSQQGDLQPWITYIQDDILESFSFRDPIKLNEKSLKFLLMMFFKFTPYYKIRSEQELTASSNQGGYSDLILIKARDDVKFEWLFELKYIKFGDINIKQQSGKQIQKKVLLEHKLVQEKMKEAKNQLERYKIIYEKKYIAPANSTQMKYAVILFVGKEFVFFEEI